MSWDVQLLLPLNAGALGSQASRLWDFHQRSLSSLWTQTELQSGFPGSPACAQQMVRLFSLHNHSSQFLYQISSCVCFTGCFSGELTTWGYPIPPCFSSNSLKLFGASSPCFIRIYASSQSPPLPLCFCCVFHFSFLFLLLLQLFPTPLSLTFFLCCLFIECLCALSRNSSPLPS